MCTCRYTWLYTLNVLSGAHEHQRCKGACNSRMRVGAIRIPLQSKIGFQMWKPNTSSLTLGVGAPSLKLAMCTIGVWLSQGVAKRSSELDDVLPRSKRDKLDSVELPLPEGSAKRRLDLRTVSPRFQWGVLSCRVRLL